MRTTLLLLVCGYLLSCSPSRESGNGSLVEESIELDTTTELETEVFEAITPVFGCRLVVTGDFNGDKLSDTLTEHFVSQSDGQEIPKFYRNMTDYGQLVDTTVRKRPLSYVGCSDSSIDSLFVSDDEQLFGLSFLKNEGDLDGDGNDEVSYVIDWADWSSLNTWHIVSFKQGKWCKLHSFAIWDWQLPSLPNTRNEYGLFGVLNKQPVDSTDEEFDQLTKEWQEFPGLVRKIRNRSIEVIYRNKEAMEDTMIVHLPRKK